MELGRIALEDFFGDGLAYGTGSAEDEEAGGADDFGQLVFVVSYVVGEEFFFSAD